jgi:hypothetical protein
VVDVFSRIRCHGDRIVADIAVATITAVQGADIKLSNFDAVGTSLR